MIKKSHKKARQNNSGFSLIELLLVLSVAFTITAAIVPISTNYIKGRSEKDAIKSFSNVIYMMQSYSIAHELATRLSFVDGGVRYQVIAQDGKLLAEQSLPPTMVLAKNSGLKEISFTNKGNISAIGKMRFTASQGDYVFTFQMEKGRFYIEEPK